MGPYFESAWAFRSTVGPDIGTTASDTAFLSAASSRVTDSPSPQDDPKLS